MLIMMSPVAIMPVIVMPVITVPVVTPSLLSCRHRTVGAYRPAQWRLEVTIAPPSGSTAITVVAVAMRTARVSNTVINLIIVSTIADADRNLAIFTAILRASTLLSLAAEPRQGSSFAKPERNYRPRQHHIAVRRIVRRAVQRRIIELQIPARPTLMSRFAPP
jgi:hypothetical protein